MKTLDDVLTALQSGEIDLSSARELVARYAFESHDIGTIDQNRESRTGVPEVIFAEKKGVRDVVALLESYREQGRQLIASRVSAELRDALGASFFHDDDARISAVFAPESNVTAKRICVVSAGGSDRPIAREVTVCAQLFGLRTSEVFDVGVAGLARMTTQLDTITDSDVVVVVAGMDGALPSVIAGLVRQPIIAVPTSVGYGAAFEGLAALLAMLNACAPGVMVVNIDNGFGAAAAAKKILNGHG